MLSKINIRYGVLLVLLISIIYSQVLYADFLFGWDDQWFVTNYYTEGGINRDNIFAIFTEFYRGQYAPVNQLYYTTLHNIFGYNKPIFHLASLSIHLLNTLLVFQITKSVIKNAQNCPKNIFPFLTASLFAIMPINIEPVAWVSASKVILYAFFYLIALNLYIRYIDRRKEKFYILTLFVFVLSFLAKEQAVTLPLTLILLDWYKGRNFNDRDVWLEKAPFLILSLLFGLVTIDSQELNDNGNNFYPIFQRIPLSIFTFFEYLTKCVIPINLSYLYPFPFKNGDQAPLWMWLYPIALPFLLWNLCYVKDKLILFGMFFFAINILLVCNLTSLARYSLIADRYTYLASIGVCILIIRIFQILYFKSQTRTKIFAGIYFFALLCYSFNYVQTWKNAYSVKARLKTTIESRPDFTKLKLKR
ncbi:hypothetical protein AAW12_05055 [Sphingobacterium sp. Ag1]|uniref:hypothetical protein n=1 Tax=Sphingobacterium sp. Ag1 TaxID=1643451 RepID=UPI000627843E|nr:hypothetical protein [Sphingobacterium sp. Ag1]KKO92470.1 hypothetical protein AAW12_05055 [Sphingobacterium sp. Ag1]